MEIQVVGVSGRHPAASANAPDAIQALSLRIAKGGQVAVIGPSGACKTYELKYQGSAL